MADWAPEHFVPVAGFLILALALLLFYFSAMRPRRGTTEWMGRIDRPRFAALRCGRLRALDAPWGVLAAACGAAAAVLAASVFAPQTADFLRLQTAYAALEAAAAYLWLRLLCADALTAALSAALLPAMLPEGPAAALVLLSLPVLQLWMGRDPKKGLFPAGLLLPGFTLLFGAAVLLDGRFFWLAPVYVGAYVFAQLQRWHFAEHARLRALLASLGLTVLTVALCVPVLYAGRELLAGKSFAVLGLADGSFFSALLGALGRGFAGLRQTAPETVLRWRECYVLLYAAASLLPVLHGLIRLRELRCAALLLLPLPFFALRLLGGVDLLPAALLALPAWTLTTLGRRWRGAEILCAVAMPLFYLMELWIP